jgi:hypothetical protein
MYNLCYTLDNYNKSQYTGKIVVTNFVMQWEKNNLFFIKAQKKKNEEKKKVQVF